MEAEAGGSVLPGVTVDSLFSETVGRRRIGGITAGAASLAPGGHEFIVFTGAPWLVLGVLKIG